MDISDFYGPNAGYVMELYDRYLADPASVDVEWRGVFDGWEREAPAPASLPAGHAEPPCEICDVTKVVAAARVGRLARELGHLAARLDPLGSPPPGDPGLVFETHGITADDLMQLSPAVIGGPLADGAENALDAVMRLRRAYSGTIGYEDDHIQIAEERDWFRNAAETGRFLNVLSVEEKRDLLQRLTDVETFERFLHRTFPTDKRFSIEGTDMLVPMLDLIIREAAASETREVVMGMAHRGRLNVLAHILGKPYAAILTEFKAAHQEVESSSVSGGGTLGWTGDVKYHQGFELAYSDESVEMMPITLAPNPSHLEFVNPVVTGRARAAQEIHLRPGAPQRDMKASLAILIHGDAAFPGQGIVAETLNLSQLHGYGVGGTIHIIVNNQIGFTTTPKEDRSTLYASDLAKGFEIPIVHVNADDPEACIATVKMATEYREKFGKDFLIDLIGYRRYGHNEGDEPAFTQPEMYRTIAAHPRVREIWAGELERQGIIKHEEADAMVAAKQEELQAALNGPPMVMEPKHPDAHSDARRKTVKVNTAVSSKALTQLNDELLARPPGFAVHPTLERVLTRRREGLGKEAGIDWGHAESLAFASMLADGTPIRLTGQDTERGTFGHRNAVLHDPNTGKAYCPFKHIPSANASFDIHNSPLSENAALGFEYGYSMHATDVLVLWEAQFGDFVNSAQVIVDQFIVSGHSKWQQTPSLVLLLPHGYEGQGPEHSSSRMERFLQLAANDNIRVVNCTTSAQYFHVLRRQAALLKVKARPLVVFTPKSLLRHPRAACSLMDLTHGGFQSVIDDEEAMRRAKKVTRIVMCSGKIWTDLVSRKVGGTPDFTALVRLEELYPFPEDELRRVMDGYPETREIVWLQEEPRNMGAWNYVAPQLWRMGGDAIELKYVGRAEAASPAEGSHTQHTREQARILSAALEPAGPARIRKNGAANVR
jgi:2-oxoglutarate dehydrogenase E1 component